MKLILFIFIITAGCATTKPISKWKEVCYITSTPPFKQCYLVTDE